MTSQSLSSARVSRRKLVATTTAGTVLGVLATSQGTMAHGTRFAERALARSQDTVATPEGLRMWLLASPDALRPADPGAPTQAEIDEVVAAQATPSDETVAAIARW